MYLTRLLLIAIHLILWILSEVKLLIIHKFLNFWLLIFLIVLLALTPKVILIIVDPFPFYCLLFHIILSLIYTQKLAKKILFYEKFSYKRNKIEGTCNPKGFLTSSLCDIFLDEWICILYKFNLTSRIICFSNGTCILKCCYY